MRYVVRALQDKKRILIIFMISSLCAALHAAEFEPFAATTPATTMQSVNNSSYMTSGSAYSGAVYTVGASEPNNAPSRPGQIRKAGGPGSTGGTSDYDPNNPQFSPIGDALIPLILMVMAYATVLFLRRRRKRA